MCACVAHTIDISHNYLLWCHHCLGVGYDKVYNWARRQWKTHDKKNDIKEFERIVNRMNSRFRSPHYWAVNFKSCTECHAQNVVAFIETVKNDCIIGFYWISNFICCCRCALSSLLPFLLHFSLPLALASACYESIGCCEIEADEPKERKTCNTHDKVNWLA